MMIADIFAQLAGDWVFHRTLTQQGEVKGYVSFKYRQPTQLHYQEEGFFTTIHHKTLPIQREYYYVYDPVQACVAVHFVQGGELGQLFHSLRFQFDATNQHWQATGEHQCCQDNYFASYNFLREDTFTLTYKVLGPQKNYIARTVFSRSL